MKNMTQNVIVLLAIVLALSFSGCAGSKGSMKVYVLGVDINEKVEGEDVGMVILGMAASVATHVAGHYIAAELVDGHIDQQGIREIVTNYEDLDQSDRRMIGRGGFAAQSIVNTVLTHIPATKDWKFTRGFTLGTMAEVGLYPLSSPPSSGDGDLWMIEDNGGSAKGEWFLYTSLAGYNFYKINDEQFKSDYDKLFHVGKEE
jgi:hypothetical protein